MCAMNSASKKESHSSVAAIRSRPSSIAHRAAKPGRITCFLAEILHNPVMRPLLITTLLGLGLVVAGCTPTTPQFSVHQPVLKAKLDNGIRLVVIPDKTTQLVQVDVRYEVGSNEDPEGKAGLAHLVEHMMFQHRFGSDKTPIERRQPTFQLLPQIATFFNAYTIWDKTHYFLQAPKEKLETLLQLEAARLNTGCKLIPQEQFEREREVVRAEIRGSLENPESLMVYEALRMTYPEGHPYHEMTGGDDQQLSTITMDDVCKFMAEYYVPSRAIVIVTGNADQVKVGKMVNYYFGSLKSGKPAPRLAVTPITIRKKRVVKQFDMDRTIVNILWALPQHNTAEYENAWFMQFIFSNVVNGMADEYDICSAVGSTELGGALAPAMWAGFEVHKGKTAKQCLDFIWKAARQTHRYFETGNYKQEEISRAQAKAQFVTSMEDISARAEFVADAVQFDKRIEFTGEDNYFYKKLDSIDKLNIGKFKSFVKRTLDPNKAIVFIAEASKDGKRRDTRSNLKFSAKTHTQKPDPVIDPATANIPLPAPKQNSILASAERYTLSNGMHIILLPYEGMPIVQANLLFKTGSVFEPESKAGLADMATNLYIPRGGSAMRAADIRVFSSGSMSATNFSARGINIYLREIIEGIERTVKVGTISQKAIEKYRKKFKDQFSRPRYQRNWIYGLTQEAAIYGEKHPYVTKGAPTPKTLAKFGRDDALSFGRKHYSAKNATLIVAGNFDVARAKSVISNSFGDWSGGRADNISELDAKPQGRQVIGVIGETGQSQMQISIAYPAPAGKDKDYAARIVLASMLNGRMGRVRSELGSTYGVRAGLRTRVGPGFYSIRGAVDATRAGESLKFMREKIAELRQGIDFNRYFVTARKSILSSLLAESTDSRSLAGRLTNLAIYDQTPAAYDELARAVASLKPADVKAVMMKDLDPSKEIIVNMADRETLNASFAEAGLSDVRIIDPLEKK